jgi:hypothetical protein
MSTPSTSRGASRESSQSRQSRRNQNQSPEIKPDFDEPVVTPTRRRRQRPQTEGDESSDSFGSLSSLDSTFAVLNADEDMASTATTTTVTTSTVSVATAGAQGGGGSQNQLPPAPPVVVDPAVRAAHNAALEEARRAENQVVYNRELLLGVVRELRGHTATYKNDTVASGATVALAQARLKLSEAKGLYADTEKLQKHFNDNLFKASLMPEKDQRARLDEARRFFTCDIQPLIAEVLKIEEEDKSMFAGGASGKGAVNVQVKPLELPTFDGRAEEKYPNFKKLLFNVVMTNPAMTPTVRMMHLKHQLKGPALQVVAKLGDTEEDLKEAWRALDQRFGDPRRLKQKIVDSILALQVPESWDEFSQRRAHDNVRQLWNNLLQVDKNCKIYDEGFKAAVYRQYSPRVREAVERRLNKRDPPVHEMIETAAIVVEDHCRYVEASQMDKSKKRSDKEHPRKTGKGHQGGQSGGATVALFGGKPATSDASKAGGKPKTPSKGKNPAGKWQSKGAAATGGGATSGPDQSRGGKCAICQKGAHAVEKCDAFKRMPVRDRVEAVKRNRLCFICLKANHLATECRGAQVCGAPLEDGGKCQLKNHHRLVHRQKAKQD